MALAVGVNSYISLGEAENYFGDRLYAEPWTTASADNKSKALVTATRRIDRLSFAGEKTDAAQPLQFPRMLIEIENKVYQRTPFGIVPYQVVQTTVPPEVKFATCEEALALLDYGSNHRIKLQHQGVIAFTTDEISETFSENQKESPTTIAKKLYSKEAMGLLRPYMARSVVIGNRESGVVRPYPWM